ncbi:winged helix-turn-helix domain-containing protein [Streptomyces sp. NPDC059985]|uniref:winged helix-turn-helix domain-containing protein n=1 Tax=Streptomyces sp. NPDC059985 TaxID=3347025 RepID=UPI0036BE9761
MASPGPAPARGAPAPESAGHRLAAPAPAARLLRRHGWSWQAPARRAFERDEHAVELWEKEVWPLVKASRRHPGPGSSSRTKPDSR